jgi:bifunctional non-homologous end joining protein LigD
MRATLATALPTGDQWTYEVKWDGYRALALKEGSRVRLYSRNLKDVTAAYPSVVREIGGLKGDVLVDGELVAVDDEGQPSFQALHHMSATTVQYYVFDILHAAGRDLTRETLEVRRRCLDEAARGTSVLRSEPLPGTTAQIEQAVRALGLEGVVAKRRDSRYEAGRRSHSWIKVKFSRRQEFVVGGIKPLNGAFDSVLVGYYRGRDLYYAGKVRAGFTPRTRTEMARRLVSIGARKCPFVNLPSIRSGHWGEGISAEEMTVLRWVKPALVVEVAFTEWTRDGNLRHSSFAGFRDDKKARDVVRET